MEHPTTCPHCGAAVVGAMKFCTSCGKSVLNVRAADPLRPRRDPMRTFYRISIAIFVILIVLIAIGLGAATSGSPPTSSVRVVTINGRDEQGSLIDPVNVWKSYTDRSQGVAGQAHDGQRVAFIQKQGGATQIELPNGARGWVNSAFIKN